MEIKMIPKNELRIGNWVKVRNKNIVITDIFKEGANMADDDYETYPDYNLEDLEPIPITAQILEACGFEPDIDNNRFTKLKIKNKGNGYISLRCLSDISFMLEHKLKIEEGQIHGTIIWLPCDPQYLHQLQNLYFALTGTELEVKQLEKA